MKNDATLIQKFLRLPAKERIFTAFRFLRGLRIGLKSERRALVDAGRRIKLVRENGKITIDRYCTFGDDLHLVVIGKSAGEKAEFEIGMGSYVGPRTIINVTRSVRIGEDCMISWDCDIRDTSWHRIRYLDREPKPVSEPIVIQDHVWIGSHTIIEKGVTIGRNSVIGSCSKVIRDIPANSLAAGNPAIVLTEIEGWDQNPDFPDARYDNRKDYGLERT